MITKEKGEEQAENASDKVIYKIDVPANMYLCQVILLSHIRCTLPFLLVSRKLAMETSGSGMLHV